jgi:hypothetical protein
VAKNPTKRVSPSRQCPGAPRHDSTGVAVYQIPAG